MGEENNIDKLFRSRMEPMNVNPPDRSRMMIDAELDKKRALLYQKRIKNYRMIAAVLAILLVSFAAFYFIEPLINTKAVTAIEKENSTESKSTINQNIKPESSENLTNNTEVSDNSKEANRDSDDNLTGNSYGATANDNQKEVNEAENNKILVASNNNNNNLNSDIFLDDSYENEFNHSITRIPLSDDLIQVNANYYAKPGSINLIPIYSNNIIETNQIASVNPVSVYLFYSPNYSYCLLKDNTPDVVDDVQMYKDQEKPEFSYSTGFALRYNLSERWGFSAGLTYSTVTKSISLLNVYADGTEDNMYYAYPTSSGMIELPHPENISIEQGDSLKLDRDSEKILKFVSIPLLARYTIPKEKINWFVNGGLSVNFLVQDQARIVAGNTEEIVNNKTQGLKKTSYGFVLGAGVEYKLMKNFNLVFEPVYKGTFTSITEDAAVKNYPFSVGVNLGASINF